MRFCLSLSVFLIALSCQFVSAQESSQPVLDVQLHRGLIMQADRNMLHLTNTTPLAAEIRCQAAGGRLLHYPRLTYGGTLGYYHYRHPFLGSSLAVFPWLSFPLLEKNRLTIKIQMGAGGAWHSKPYHPEKNNLNNTIGSPFTAALQLKSGLSYSLNKRLVLQAGLALTHFSNGGSAMPNKGLNLMSAYTGLGYRFQAKSRQQLETDQPAESTNWQYQLTFSAGRQQMKNINSGFYSFLNLNAAAFKQQNAKGGFLLGADVFYNPGLESLRKYLPDEEAADENYYRVGIFVGYLMRIERLSIHAQLGYYAYRPYDVYQPVYQRYGLRYRLNKHFFASAALKAHFGEAEAIEWGIGLSL